MQTDTKTPGWESGPRTRQFVEQMQAYVARGAAAFEADYGEEASDVVQEMMAALMGQLEGNLGHVVLWEQFLRTPDEVSDALAGVIAELRCQSPAFNEWLSDAWARYEACTGQTGAREGRG